MDMDLNIAQMVGIIVILIAMFWFSYNFGKRKSKKILEEKDTVLRTALLDAAEASQKKPLLLSDKELDALAKKMREAYDPKSTRTWDEMSKRVRTKWITAAKEGVVYINKRILSKY